MTRISAVKSRRLRISGEIHKNRHGDLLMPTSAQGTRQPSTGGSPSGALPSREDTGTVWAKPKGSSGPDLYPAAGSFDLCLCRPADAGPFHPQRHRPLAIAQDD